MPSLNGHQDEPRNGLAGRLICQKILADPDDPLRPSGQTAIVHDPKLVRRELRNLYAPEPEHAGGFRSHLFPLVTFHKRDHFGVIRAGIYRSSSFAMISRMISLVPAPMGPSRASRQARWIGYSIM